MDALPPGSARLALLSRLAATLPKPWTATGRRRRLLFLALAAPGFFAIFATPLHRNLLIMIAGVILFAAAIVFRAHTEPLFERAGAASFSPSADPDNPTTTETHNA